MNTPNLLKTLRYYIGADSSIQTLLGEATAQDTRKHLVMMDAVYVSKDSGYSYPRIGLLVDDDAPRMRGCDDNTVDLFLDIANKYANADCALVNLKLKDRLKDLIDEKHADINDQAVTLSLSLKLRGIFWVSGVTYNDKTQGSERLHRYNCQFVLTVGD